jgi:hypothetical protein
MRSATPSTLKRSSSAVFFILYFCVASNIPFWIACRLLNLLPSGFFLLESLVAGLIALYVSRRLSVLLLFIFFAGDILCAVVQTYYLTSWDAVSHTAGLSALSPYRQVLIVVVALFALLYFCIPALPWLRVAAGTSRSVVAVTLIIFGIVGLIVDRSAVRKDVGGIANLLPAGHSFDSDRLTSTDGLKFFRYIIWRLGVRPLLFEHKSHLHTARSLAEYPGMTGATQIALSQVDVSGQETEARRDIVLVVVESWGLFNNHHSEDLLSAIYSEGGLSNRYEIQQGSVPFVGTTVYGEVRELCGSSYGFAVEQARPRELTHCLPERLNGLGYQTTAVHGMDGRLFARNEWYANVGFKDNWFQDRLLAAGLQQCGGAIRGVCDSSISSWITQRLQSSKGPQFIYWMTLNSHLPLAVPSGLANGAACDVLPPAVSSGALCSWYQLIANVHQSIAQMARTVTRPTVFIIVGDHAPPFANETIRDLFSQSQVPYIILLPKELPLR